MTVGELWLFSINISLASVAKNFRFGGVFDNVLYCKFTAEYAVEKNENLNI